MNVLFICSANKWRSRTAEDIFKNAPGINVKSAGTQASARIRVGTALINWSQIIFCMEKTHKQKIIKNFPQQATNKKIIILDIPDEYQYMDPELVQMLKIVVAPYF